MESAFEFLEEIKQKAGVLSVERLLDFVYEHFDQLLRKHNFSSVDEILLVTDPASLPLDALFTFLVVTFPAGHELKNRADFFSRAKKYLIEEKNLREDILNGLE